MTRVHIGGDHAAYDLLNDLVDILTADGHDVVNHGPLDFDAEDDYPVFVLRAAQAVDRDGGADSGASGRLGHVGGSSNQA